MASNGKNAFLHCCLCLQGMAFLLVWRCSRFPKPNLMALLIPTKVYNINDKWLCAHLLLGFLLKSKKAHPDFMQVPTSVLFHPCSQERKQNRRRSLEESGSWRNRAQGTEARQSNLVGAWEPVVCGCVKGNLLCSPSVSLDASGFL